MRLASSKKVAINTQRIGWVDGLKGVSAIVVVLQHTLVTVFGLSASAAFRIPVVHNLWDGNFAVSVFIILSTILACHGIERHRDDLLRRYRYIVLKRYFRLVVPVGVIIVAMYLLNLAGLFYAEEFGAKTGNEWLMHSTETLVHLPGNILCAPLGGCYTVLRVGWMLKYVFLGTMWAIILDLLLAGRRWQSRLFLLALCTYIAWKCDGYYINVVVGYAFYSFRKELQFGGGRKMAVVSGADWCVLRQRRDAGGRRVERVESHLFGKSCLRGASCQVVLG